MKKIVCWMMLVTLFSWGLIGCSLSETKKTKYFEKGKYLYKKGDYIQARRELKSAILIDPKFAIGYYHLGLVELKTSEYKNAITCFKNAAKLNPHLLEAELELGRLYLIGGATKKALKQTESILSKDEGNTQALQLKVAAFLQKNKLTAAKALLSELLREGISDENTYFLLGTTAIFANDLKKAKHWLTKGISINPKSVKLLLLKANILMISRHFSETETLLKQIVKIQPTEKKHILRLAEFYWQTKRYKKMTHQIDIMVTQNPSNVNTRIQASHFYQKKSDFDTAETLLKKGLQIEKESVALYLALARLYLEQNRLDAIKRVLNVCQNLISDEKSVFAVRTKSLLAQTRLIEGNFKGAKAAADDVLCLDHSNADAHYIKGKLFLLDRNYKAAIEEFKFVITQTPGFETAHQSLAQVYNQKKEAEKALIVLKKAVEYLPFSKSLRQALAKTYTARKEFGSAETHLRYLAQYWPMDPMSYINLGDFFMATNQFIKAEQTFFKLLNLHKENAAVYLKLSKLYQKAGEPQKALAILQKANLKNRSDANRLLDARIRLLMDQDRFNDALSICSRRLSQNSNDVFALNLQGIIHTRQKNSVAAKQDFENAITLSPHWPAPHANMARLLFAKGDVQNAISNFESALQLEAAEINVYLDLAKVYKTQKNYPKVIQVYEKVLAIHPNMWVIANNLAFYLAEYSSKPEDLKRALRLVHRAQLYTLFNPYVEDTLAWIFYKQGHLKKAHDTMEIVLNHYPHNPIFNYHMGTILKESGMISAAHEQLSLASASKKKFVARQDARTLLDRLKK
jgi:tetratricopeptide (TPR) repeat protein